MDNNELLNWLAALGRLAEGPLLAIIMTALYAMERRWTAARCNQHIDDLRRLAGLTKTDQLSHAAPDDTDQRPHASPD